MKFVFASYGTRGDVEPCVAVGRELIRRGHEVRVAVAPNLVGFVESAGLVAVACGLDSQIMMERHAAWNLYKVVNRDFLRNLCRDFPGNLRAIQDLIRSGRGNRTAAAQIWAETARTLMSLANAADLLIANMDSEQHAANAAEYYNIPLAALHVLPIRPHGHYVPSLPSPLVRSAMRALLWLNWRALKKFEDAHRRQLGLPKATRPGARRITERGSLEIQAYDKIVIPGLAAEWAKWAGQRPFVGSLTLELPTDADDEVMSWIAAGTPPIYVGFGSMTVGSAADTVAMISAACAQLGERALVCSGWSDFSDIPQFDNVKIVSTVNFAAVFPFCRAVVHHGGAGTTAAGLRAGVPTLICSILPDQQMWGAHVKRMKVGTARRFSTITEESLVADLRTILAPQCVVRAHEIASRMTKPAESVAAAADLVERFARTRRNW